MTSIVFDKQNVTYFPTDTIYSQETQDNHFFWLNMLIKIEHLMLVILKN